MRMEQAGPRAPPTSSTARPRAELADLIYPYGEERRSRAVARAIVAARKTRRSQTTKRLADIVASRRCAARRRTFIPATRTFQALRIAVNDELGELERALEAAERVLAPGGRLVVVTFHSLEDRIVKQFLRERSGRDGRAVPPCPGTARGRADLRARHAASRSSPAHVEIVANPRARSAKLRRRRSGPPRRRRPGARGR